MGKWVALIAVAGAFVWLLRPPGDGDTPANEHPATPGERDPNLPSPPRGTLDERRAVLSRISPTARARGARQRSVA